MSVYIKGMEMPTNCEDCIFCDGDACLMHKPDEFRSLAEEYKNCPLVPVPGHGRLIDADALRDNNCDAFEISGADRTILAMDVSIIDAAPTIIPADPEKEGEG